MSRPQIFRNLAEQGYGRVYRDKSNKVRFAQRKHCHLSLRFNRGNGIKIYIHPGMIKEQIARLNACFAKAGNVRLIFGYPKRQKKHRKQKTRARAAPHR